MGKRRTKLSDQLRQAIDGCGISRYAISKATAIGQDTLSLFMSGKRGLPMKTLDRLADFLDLNITTGKPPATKGRNRNASTNSSDTRVWPRPSSRIPESNAGLELGFMAIPLQVDDDE